MTQKRRNHKPDFKAKVALEALKERESIEALAKKFELSPSQISAWKATALLKLSEVFSTEQKPENKPLVDTEKLYAQIGQLKVENDFLKKKLY